MSAASAAPVVVLGEATAKRLFASNNPIGRRLGVRTVGADGQPQPPNEATIIGVVGDDGPDAGGARYPMYGPLEQAPDRSDLWIVARSRNAPEELLPILDRTVRGLDPQLAVSSVETALRLARPEYARRILVSGYIAVLGAFTLALALGGLYGLLTHVMTRRTKEIGLRQALGAGRQRVIGMIVREGMSPVLAGVTVGVASGVLVRMAARPAFLRPVPEIDAWALAVMPIGVILVALAACFLPARRAARVDPATALREF
jgi:hypothetical protein